jgi:5-methylcytosine-specific restriction endonuclease McrA
MGMRARRICKRCHSIAVAGSSFCERHQGADAARERTYRDPGLQRLYKTRAWAQTRAAVLARDEQCTATLPNGSRCTRLSTDVHHVVRAEVWLAQGGDFCDMDNLAGVCRECHSRHTAKEVGFAGWNRKALRYLANARRMIVAKLLKRKG